MCFSRFDKLHSYLIKFPEIFDQYHQIINEQLDNYTVEKIWNYKNNEIFHYIYHRHILRRDDSSTKLTIIYNKYSKEYKNYFSLNECLLKGNTVYKDLTVILRLFLMNVNIKTSDVEKAFYYKIVSQKAIEMF